MKENTMEALKKAKDAVNQASDALDLAMEELDGNELDTVSGGAGVFSRVPKVLEHSYNDEDKDRY